MHWPVGSGLTGHLLVHSWAVGRQVLRPVPHPDDDVEHAEPGNKFGEADLVM